MEIVVRLPILLGSCFLALLTGSAYAQDTGEADKPAKRNANRLLEEVVVTAQKREEDSQDIPITLSAFSSEKLDAFGIDKVEDLTRVTPGLTFTTNVGYTVIYLRGIGADAFLPSADASIATYVDGINKVAGHGLQSSLGPVERVEVLKGPQGTLFGRNATGGAINIVTAPPPQEFIGSVTYEKSEYQGLEGGVEKKKFFFGTPITDSLGMTFSGYSQEYDPTMFNERVPGSGDLEAPIDHFSEGLRTKIAWDATDNLTFTFVGDYNNQMDPSSMIQENTRPSPSLQAGAETRPLDRIYHNDRVAGTASRAYTAGLITDWSTDKVDLKLILSDQFFDNYWSQLDYDTSEKDGASFVAEQFADQQTAELQILSNENSLFSDKLEWVAGLYYLEGVSGFPFLHLTVDALGLGAGVAGLPVEITNLLDLVTGGAQKVRLATAGELITEAISVYTQGTWSFNNEFSATVGLRYQEEERYVENTYLALLNDDGSETTLDSFEADPVEDENFSWRFAFQWFFSDTAQLYTSLSRGYKSPTLNTINFFSAPDAVEREEATAFELGAKSEWLDGALRLNGAVFVTEVKNLLTAELSITSGGVVRFDNAGTGTVEGAELDFLWQPMPNLNPGLAINGNGTYLEAIYEDYEDGSGFEEDTGLAFGPNSLRGDTSQDFSGNRIVRTPKWSASLAANQNIPIGDNSAVEIGVDYYYSDSYFTGAQNSEFFVQPQYELFNARVSYFYYPWGLQITAFGENVKNQEYFVSRQAQDFGRADTLAAPGAFGLRVKWDIDQVFSY